MVLIVAGLLLVTNLRFTLRMRSSTLSWGNDRMAAMVRISRSDNEYLLWMLCMMYHIVELIWTGRTSHPGGVTSHHSRNELCYNLKGKNYQNDNKWSINRAFLIQNETGLWELSPTGKRICRISWHCRKDTLDIYVGYLVMTHPGFTSVRILQLHGEIRYNLDSTRNQLNSSY